MKLFRCFQELLSLGHRVPKHDLLGRGIELGRRGQSRAYSNSDQRKVFDLCLTTQEFD